MFSFGKDRPAVRRLTVGAVVAAAYTVLCLVLQPLSYGPLQLRLSEALCALPLFLPEAVPGLFVGCLLSNLLGGAHVLDVIFGSLATLAAGLLTYSFRRVPLLALLAPVLINGVVVSLVLHYTVGAPLILTMLSVSASQAAVCYGCGYPLYLLLRKRDLFG